MKPHLKTMLPCQLHLTRHHSHSFGAGVGCLQHGYQVPGAGALVSLHHGFRIGRRFYVPDVFNTPNNLDPVFVLQHVGIRLIQSHLPCPLGGA